MRDFPQAMRDPRQRIVVGLIAVCWGAILGARTANLQVVVDTGQVLAGMVVLPETSPSLAYHVRAWCVLNQICAAALHLGATERALDFVLSAAMGSLWFLGISWMVLGIGRNVAAAIAAPLLVFAMVPYNGMGPVYPVFLLATIHTYGAFGPGFALLILATYAVGLRRTAAFLAGLAPGVHAAVCGATVLAFVAGAALRRSLERTWSAPVPEWRCLACGAAAALVLWGIQVATSPRVAVTSTRARTDLVEAMMRHWDNHRTPLVLDDVENLRLPTTALGASLAFGATVLRRRLPTRCRTVLWATIVVYAGSLVGLVLQAAIRDLPLFLAAAMPGRFVNVAATTGLPVALGLVVRAAGRSWLSLGLLLAAVVLPGLFDTYFDRTLWGLLTGALVVQLLLSLLAAAGGRVRAPRTVVATTLAGSAALVAVARLGAWNGVGLLGLAGAASLGIGAWLATARHTAARRIGIAPRIVGTLLAASIGTACIAPALHRGWESFCLRYTDYRSDPFWAAIHARVGPYLPPFAEDFQGATGRAPIVDLIPMTAYLYAGGGLAEYRRLVLTAYGIDLAHPPPECDDPRSNMLKASGHVDEVWRTRTTADWQQVGRELGVRDVLAPPGLDLDLPVVVRSEAGTLYEIPAADDLPPADDRPNP